MFGNLVKKLYDSVSNAPKSIRKAAMTFGFAVALTAATIGFKPKDAGVTLEDYVSPSSTVVVSEEERNPEVSEESKPATYKVKAGDTFFGIAMISNISIERLMRNNPHIVDKNRINADETTVFLNQPPEKKTYTVQRGDTLIEICNKQGFGPYNRVAEMNDIKDPNKIKPGQEITAYVVNPAKTSGQNQVNVVKPASGQKSIASVQKPAHREHAKAIAPAQNPIYEQEAKTAPQVDSQKETSTLTFYDARSYVRGIVQEAGMKEWKQDLRKTRIVVHHTGEGIFTRLKITKTPKKTLEDAVRQTIKMSEKYGIKNSGSPYHFIVNRNGSVTYAADITTRPNGAYEKNTGSFQASFAGNMDVTAPTQKQYEAFAKLVVHLKQRGYGTEIITHQQSNGPSRFTACPGKFYDQKKVDELVESYSKKNVTLEERSFDENMAKAKYREIASSVKERMMLVYKQIKNSKVAQEKLAYARNPILLLRQYVEKLYTAQGFNINLAETKRLVQTLVQHYLPHLMPEEQYAKVDNVVPFARPERMYERPVMAKPLQKAA
ncbi:LysM peptidoglycan-binding domain-containing protein [Candidatus Woesearchaeota archaeon]|nr:LysM peptidoglycan-binding domain-containing protein [Candidatus Woesearchaeota archaeon]